MRKPSLSPWEYFYGTAAAQPVYARGTYCDKVTAASGVFQAIVSIGMVGLHGVGWTLLHGFTLIMGQIIAHKVLEDIEF